MERDTQPRNSRPSSSASPAAPQEDSFGALPVSAASPPSTRASAHSPRLRTRAWAALIVAIICLSLAASISLAAAEDAPPEEPASEEPVSSPEDTADPEVTIEQPAEGAIVGGRLDGAACEAWATDDTNVEHVAFFVDGQPLSETASAPYTCEWDTTEFSDGAHVLKATAHDAAGNSSSASIDVRVDNAAPNVSFDRPTEGDKVRGKLDDPQGSECDAPATDETKMDRVAFSVDGQFLNSERYAPYTCNWDTSRFTTGEHVLKATAYDAAGNSSSSSVRVKVDNRIWWADAETGDLSQWSRQTRNCRVDGVLYHDEEHCGDRISVVSSQTSGPDSRYAYRFEVRDGDDSPYGGERNEVKQTDGDKQYARGAERYFGYSVLLEDSFPADDQGVGNDWTAFSEWKTIETHGSGPAALNMQTGDEQMSLKRAASPAYFMWRTPLVRGRWHRFVVRVKFDPNPNVGFVEVWKDGVRVKPKTYGRTLQPMNGYVDRAYSKVGYYRNAKISGDSALYVDDYTVGPSYATVRP